MTTSKSTIVSSFKDIIEKKAAKHNIVFLPIRNRTVKEKQVYRFGNQRIYIDKKVIYLFENREWIPISLVDLIDRTH